MDVDDQLIGLIEGDYVETVEGLLFSVKGLHHPEGLVIAYLRYVPDSNGNRKRGSRSYRRVYDLDETDDFLRKHFPPYLNPIESKGLTLQSLPEDRIIRVYSPREHLRALEKPLSELEATTVKFASVLSVESGVPLDKLGVSGSILIGLAGPTSDVDLVVYGIDAGLKVYDALKRLRVGRGWIRPYDPETVKGVVWNRWGDARLDPERMAIIENRKVLHGLVDGRDYFVRLVRRPAEFEREVASRPLGKVVIRGTVVDAVNSIFTPCTYHIEDCTFVNHSMEVEVTQLVSYRGKFTEQAVDGDPVEARGTLEGVIYKDRTVHRLMLGAKSDYLVPTCLMDR